MRVTTQRLVTKYSNLSCITCNYEGIIIRRMEIVALLQHFSSSTGWTPTHLARPSTRILTPRDAALATAALSPRNLNDPDGCMQSILSQTLHPSRSLSGFDRKHGDRTWMWACWDVCVWYVVSVLRRCSGVNIEVWLFSIGHPSNLEKS